MADERPAEYTPGVSKMSKGVTNQTAYHIALTRWDDCIEGPWIHLQQFLDTNPQKCQGGLYVDQTNFMIVENTTDGKHNIIYRWNAGAQKWVKEKE